MTTLTTTSPYAAGLAQPSLLRLATAGSVDDGKSTLVGRLLHDTKSVLSDQLAAVERVSRERGLRGADLALLTDGLRAEREQGITIDVAYRYFATATRSFVLADCPGHVQYTRNTVTGASTADVIVLLVDARKGVLEQTRRHLAVAALLRVPHVVVAVNKIDLIDFSEAVFRDVEAQVHAVARNLGVADARAIPVSALDGDNVVSRSSRTPWYDGPSLLELLESLPLSDEAVRGSLRLPVQLVIRPQGAALDEGLRDYRGYAGQVASGVVRVGDEVAVLPSGLRTHVTGIAIGERQLDVATAGQSVTLQLADDLDVSRGDVIAAAIDAPRPTQDVEAYVCWLGDADLRPGARLLLKHGARTVQAVVCTTEGRLDLDDLHSVSAESLSLNDIGRVTLRLAHPLPVEDYAVSRQGGAFLLIDPPRRHHPRRRHGPSCCQRPRPREAHPMTPPHDRECTNPHRQFSTSHRQCSTSDRECTNHDAFPLFVDLTDRLVVAIGGGPVSARRVTAFLTAGARVRVIAPYLCEDLLDLVHHGDIAWHVKEYAGPADLDGAWLVHTATGDNLVDKTVAADAEAARIWCIDATSATTTRASVPARAQVTTPDGKVTVAAYAHGDPGTARAVASGVEHALATGELDLRRTRQRGTTGWVALVGGGPGDDGLMTARGHQLLRSADVVVVDRLAPRGLVARLPRTVEIIDVGKTPGHHPTSQDRINEILVEQAQLGRGVVRLKGGDPYVLGRGGEERLACEAAGIPVEVVPGVTSAVSVPAAAGIPVTHRGLSRGFTVVTGHDEIPSLPTKPDHTLVLLMGVARLHETASLLIEHGHDATTPVAIVERGWTPTQRTTLGTLATIADLAATRGVESPAVIVVGDVVPLAYDWQEVA